MHRMTIRLALALGVWELTAVAAAAEPAANRCPQFFAHGQEPAAVAAPAASEDKELCFRGFAVRHSAAMRTPLWSAEVMTRGGVALTQKAQRVTDASRAQADSLDQQAQQLKAQAKEAGGYTGERLTVRADALAREAAIVDKQGRTKAAALREAADAQAKQVAAR